MHPGMTSWRCELVPQSTSSNSPQLTQTTTNWPVNNLSFIGLDSVMQRNFESSVQIQTVYYQSHMPVMVDILYIQFSCTICDKQLMSSWEKVLFIAGWGVGKQLLIRIKRLKRNKQERYMVDEKLVNLAGLGCVEVASNQDKKKG